MRADVRRKLEMATRVLEFSRANPSDDPSHATLLGRLEARLTRADSLAAQERSGRIAELAASSRRDDLRRAMHFQLLRHLVRVGEIAAKDNAELVGKFRLRMPNATHKSFLIAAKAMLADGLANKDLFVSLGLSATMLDELGKAVAQFAEATESKAVGKRSHVGAHVDLEVVTSELLELVELLNTFNRFRFRNNPELAAAWENTRNVLGPFKPRSRTIPGSGEAPPAGGLAPAA